MIAAGGEIPMLATTINIQRTHINVVVYLPQRVTPLLMSVDGLAAATIWGGG